MKVVLVSCAKTKQRVPCQARVMYVSPLFAFMRQYAETHGDLWFILSAKHGLLDPRRVITPYEQTLNTMTRAARRIWAADVAGAIIAAIPKGSTLVFLAGENYREWLVSSLAQKYTTMAPMAGMSIGRQLQWLKRVLTSPRSSGNANHSH